MAQWRNDARARQAQRAQQTGITSIQDKVYNDTKPMVYTFEGVSGGGGIGSTGGIGGGVGGVGGGVGGVGCISSIVRLCLFYI